MTDLIRELALDEAKALRNFVNPMNLRELDVEDIKPLCKKKCLHSICLGGSGGYTMHRFMSVTCTVAVVNTILDSDNVEVISYPLIMDKEWRWTVFVGGFLRQYEYLSPLEYYTIVRPQKLGKILDYVKNIDDELIL